MLNRFLSFVVAFGAIGVLVALYLNKQVKKKAQQLQRIKLMREFHQSQANLIYLELNSPTPPTPIVGIQTLAQSQVSKIVGFIDNQKEITFLGYPDTLHEGEVAQSDDQFFDESTAPTMDPVDCKKHSESQSSDSYEPYLQEDYTLDFGDLASNNSEFLSWNQSISNNSDQSPDN